MIRCPICQRALKPTAAAPYAPICSDACLREARRRAGYADAPPAEPEPEAQFEQFQATHLYCATCRGSMPTKERLLLTLPSGDLYGYTCAHCGTDVGTKTTSRAAGR